MSSVPGETRPIANPPVSLVEIFLVFLRLGLLSFGGGLSGWVYREVVEQRKWATESDFLSGLALSQMMPGTNIGNLAVYVGMRLRGAVGSIAALFGLVTGPFLAVLGLLAVYSRIAGFPQVTTAMDGVTSAALGLLLLVGAKATWRIKGNIAAIIAMCATFVLVGLLELPLLLVVFSIAPLSIIVARLRQPKNA